MIDRNSAERDMLAAAHEALSWVLHKLRERGEGGSDVADAVARAGFHVYRAITYVERAS